MTAVVHLRCGDDLRVKLPAAGFPGRYLSYADPVCQGLLPDLPPDRFVEARAAFVSAAYGLPRAEVLARLRAEEAALMAALDADRVVLWFEHDRWDQLILVRVLSRIADDPRTLERVWLMSVDRFPGVPVFVGFGQLTAEQLATLAGRERPVTPAQLDLARRTWAALRAPTPKGLQELVGGAAALPFLADALRRHLQDLPWTTDGLSLTERLCLAAADDGRGERRTLAEIFASVQAADPAIGFGDLQLLPPLHALTLRGLLAERDGGWLPAGPPSGPGIDDSVTWRWDPERGSVVPPTGTSTD
ncbi:MAG TPA: DUF1835 domain-containing protein [Micromonosporaceae bacterium]|nr:DUF1835 domain-containing protein [Micromonosporaceae bacterium]